MQYPLTNDLKAPVSLHIDLRDTDRPDQYSSGRKAGLWAHYPLIPLLPVLQLGHQGNSDTVPWGFVSGCPLIVDIRQLAKLGVGP